MKTKKNHRAILQPRFCEPEHSFNLMEIHTHISTPKKCCSVSCLKRKGVTFIPRNMGTCKRSSSFKATTFPSARHRKAVLRLRQIRQMDHCCFLELCISRSTGQIWIVYVFHYCRHHFLTLEAS